jgi:hypothetical protein
LPYQPIAWLPFALLQLSVAARVGADLAGSTWARGWTAHGNTTAILLFVGLSALAAVRSRRERQLHGPAADGRVGADRPSPSGPAAVSR